MFHIPCLGALPALCKLGCSATEVLGLPSLSACPAVRHPQPRPGGRVREESSPPTYYAWMQTGRAYSVFPSVRSRLQAGRRRRLPAPRGCPARLGNRAARPRHWVQKALLGLRGLSQSRPAGDRGELRLEAGNRAARVRLEAKRPTPGGFPPRLTQAAAPDPALGGCGQGSRSFGGIAQGPASRRARNPWPPGGAALRRPAGLTALGFTLGVARPAGCQAGSAASLPVKSLLDPSVSTESFLCLLL